MRYLPLTPDDRSAMLAVIGAKSIDDLYTDVPEAARRAGLVDLPRAQGEIEVERALKAYAARNVSPAQAPFFVGAGAYRHHVPASVDHLIQRSEFLTAYTPYQPEIAQGTLQSIFEFQTQVAMLTGMEAANASMYDGSTACAEAALMASRVTRRSKIVLSGGLHPHYAAATRTMAGANGVRLAGAPSAIDGEAEALGLVDEETAAVIVQSPNVFGVLSDLSAIAEAAHAKGALVIAVFTEAVALGLVEPPGAMGADIVVGEGQSIGVPLSFGGPYVGLFATREQFVRQMPGRLAGETLDADGARGYVLTLSTREQHIRRAKATSNICTNSGLCMQAFTIHLTLLGALGLKRLAALNHEKACALADALAGVPGVEILSQHFFNEFAYRTAKPAGAVIDALAARGVLGGVAYARLDPGAGMDDVIIACATETNTGRDIAAYAAALKEILQ
jgi:glycine dehydrogenase subunit 1